jgi:alkylhydroperoxidase family enzyme
MEKQMQSRIDYSKAPPGAMKAMQAVQQYVNESGLEPRLLELVKLRASQINGCVAIVATTTMEKLFANIVGERASTHHHTCMEERDERREADGHRYDLCKMARSDSLCRRQIGSL